MFVLYFELHGTTIWFCCFLFGHWDLFKLAPCPISQFPIPQPHIPPPLHIKSLWEGLGPSSPIEARQGGPFRGGDSTSSQATVSGTAPAPLVGGLALKTMSLICNICVGGLDPGHAFPLIHDSVSGSPQGSNLVDSVGLSVKSSSGPSLNFSKRLPNLNLIRSPKIWKKTKYFVINPRSYSLASIEKIFIPGTSLQILLSQKRISLWSW